MIRSGLFGLGRFIPARAGNGSHGGSSGTWYPVHPRACGERAYDEVGSSVKDGSSPRVRGTDLQIVDLEVVERFIPARAGNG